VGIAVRQDPAGDARGEARLELAAAPGRQPLRLELEGDLQLVQTAELLDVVAVGGDDERAALAIAGGQAGPLLELGRERRPALAPGQVEAELGLLAEVGLRDGRQHAGGDARGAGARGGRAVDDEHGQAAPARAPSAREADQSRADHDGVVACAPRQLHHLPFAGITRVRFDGRRRRSRPLSPVPPSSR
jgi:hypothetical protein